jgi:hypothetical protein
MARLLPSIVCQSNLSSALTTKKFQSGILKLGSGENDAAPMIAAYRRCNYTLVASIKSEGSYRQS